MVQVFGLTLITLGTLGILDLLFFYGVILFSEKWSIFQDTYDMFRLIFTIPTGLIVIYASFFVLFIPLLACVLYGLQLFLQKTYITKTLVICLAIVWQISLLFGMVTVINQMQHVISRITPFSTDPVAFNIESEIPLSSQYVFKTTLKNEVQRTLGIPIGGYEPAMFLTAFPGLSPTDFEGVEASIGYYTIEFGKLVHKTDDTRLIHSAAQAITDRGLDTLLANVSVRLGVDLTTDGTLTEIMEALLQSPTQEPPAVYEGGASGSGGGSAGDVGTGGDSSGGGVLPPSDDTMIACTMDAKLCSDGSAVGRQGPNCEFAPCPGESPASQTHVCTLQEKQTQACTKEYRPVCGLIAILCVTTPCNPIPETFSNGCAACAQPLVSSYTDGACAL